MQKLERDKIVMQHYDVVEQLLNQAKMALVFGDGLHDPNMAAGWFWFDTTNSEHGGPCPSSDDAHAEALLTRALKLVGPPPASNDNAQAPATPSNLEGNS